MYTEKWLGNIKKPASLQDVINGRGLAPQVLGTRPYKYKTNPLFHPNKIQETKELIVE